MDNKLSRRVALDLVAATTADDVHAVLRSDDAREWFDNAEHWSPYGGREKNWDTVGNQMSNPIGALVEIITNGIDAILLRKAKEGGISDARGSKAPQSMTEAVKRFFPQVLEGKIVQLEPAQRSALAEQCIRIGVRRGVRKNHLYPTYTIIDAGEGQEPSAFPKTFLSLGEKNKEGISFVQGKFNMGSTGTLRFCTRSDLRLGHYKLIVSRRPGDKIWGWTIIRVREARASEALPVAEYFHPYSRAIPRFETDSIAAFGHKTLGVVSEGTIVKVFEYDIGPEARSIDLGLYNALTVNLIDCALPVQLYDFDAKPIEGKGPLRREGIAARTFSGLNVVLRADTAGASGLDEEDAKPAPAGASDKPMPAITEFVHQVEDIRDEDLGRVRIIATSSWPTSKPASSTPSTGKLMLSSGRAS